MTPFPWAAAMQFGFGVLRLSPQEFWAMSPRELVAAHAAIYRQTAPLDRVRFAELMNEFPDEESANVRC